MEYRVKIFAIYGYCMGQWGKLPCCLLLNQILCFTLKIIHNLFFLNAFFPPFQSYLTNSNTTSAKPSVAITKCKQAPNIKFTYLPRDERQCLWQAINQNQDIKQNGDETIFRKTFLLFSYFPHLNLHKNVTNYFFLV